MLLEILLCITIALVIKIQLFNYSLLKEIGESINQIHPSLDPSLECDCPECEERGKEKSNLNATVSGPEKKDQ